MEELNNFNIGITATHARGTVSVGVVAFLSHSVNRAYGGTQEVTTTPELLHVVPGVPLWVYVFNEGLWPIMIDSVADMSAFPQYVLNGGVICLCPETSVIYVVGVGGPASVWVLSAN